MSEVIPVVLPPALPRVGRRRLALRALRMSAHLSVVCAVYLPLRVVDRIRLGREEARSRLARRLARRLERMGAAAVKMGQLAGSRADMLPPAVVESLRTLFDDATPMTAAQLESQWQAAAGRLPALAGLSRTGRLLGAGSIACVYEATDAEGRPVAVKLQRPGIAATMAADLRLIELMTRVMEKFPQAGGAPLADLVDYMNRALYGQIDFVREAEHTVALRANLADLPGVLVPAVRDEFRDLEVLVTDFVPGLDLDAPASLSAAERTAAAATALGAVGTMVFRDGFVHCDLHPGNLYVRADASVVILDAGYCVDVPDSIRSYLATFFTHLRKGDGVRCGEIMFDSALNGGPRTGRAEFVAEIAALVERTTAPDHRFEMAEFGQAVFEAQNRHGVHPPSDFAFPLMSLMVAEGTLRGFWPDIEMPEAVAPVG